MKKGAVSFTLKVVIILITVLFLVFLMLYLINTSLVKGVFSGL